MAGSQGLIDANGARSAQHGLGRLAGWCYDHRCRVLAGWLLAVVAVIGLGQWAGSRLDNNFALGGSPSQQAQNLLASRFPSQEGDSADVVLRSPGPLDSPVNAAAIGRLVRSLRPLAHVSGVQGPLGPGGRRQLSPDRRIGFVVVRFDAAAADLPASAVQRVIDTARSFARPGLQVAVGGAPVEQVVSAAPGPAETIGLLAAVVVMLLAFGSVVAMGLPILAALAGLGIGFGVLEALSHLVTVPTFGPDMMVMIGLGVGIDYALFIVTRYRQGLAEGRPPREATTVALSTAGRAVLFAGCTVVIALLGLFVVGLPFMDGLAAATIVAVALVLAAALTLLPAIFGVSRTGPIDPWIPLMMFTIVFGLSMDYEVFLLSRMREEWARNGDNAQAVTSGLASTARVITAAGAVMVCVFGSFVIGDPLRILGVFGLGLAAAVLVDVTVVRMVLVPAVMQLLGSANWWLPRWIGRAIPNLAIEPDVAQSAQPLGHDPGSVPDSPGETARALLFRRS